MYINTDKLYIVYIYKTEVSLAFYLCTQYTHLPTGALASHGAALVALTQSANAMASWLRDETKVVKQSTSV